MRTTHFGTTLGLLGLIAVAPACTGSKSDAQINLLPGDAAVDTDGGGSPDGGGGSSVRGCKVDDDCTLVATQCCGCWATLENTKSELRGFEEPIDCTDLNCGACLEPLGPPPGIEPYCERSECKLRETPAPGLDTECKVNADCQLVADCCDCGAIAASETPTSCRAACDVDKCQAHDIDRAVCVAGQCLPGRVLSCRADRASCFATPPTCLENELPRIEGACYAGCAEKAYCAEVSSCADCDEGSLCLTEVHDGDTGETYHCMPVPAACEQGKIDCACAGQLCGAGGFSECNTTETGIRCVP